MVLYFYTLVLIHALAPLCPLRHASSILSSMKDNSVPMFLATVAASSPLLHAICLAICDKTLVVLFDLAPLVVKIMGMKVPFSTLSMRSLYVLSFCSSARGSAWFGVFRV